MVVVGLIAIIFPFIASVAVTLMAGILFLITGFVTLYGAFSVQGTWAFIGALLLGLLQLVAGVYVLFNPLAGLIVFTLVIAAMFIVEGIFKIIFAFKIKPEEGWGWALVSGLISIILGVLIYSEWPGSSLVIIGLLWALISSSRSSGFRNNDVYSLGSVIRRVTSGPGSPE